jgi:hypothetical protein
VADLKRSASEQMMTSDYGIVFAVVTLLSLLWWAIRFEARKRSQPKKELRLRTRWDKGCAEVAAMAPPQTATAVPDVALKLPRKNRQAVQSGATDDGPPGRG